VSQASAGRFEQPEQQQAFVGLLTRPLLTRQRDPELHALVMRHQRVLGVWCHRLGYRLVNIGGAFRLRRVPLNGTVAVPAGPVPARRQLVLALVVAAALEDHTGDAVTLQELSDATHELTGATGVGSYDVGRRPDRLVLLQAIERLVDAGVLERRTSQSDLLRAWEDEGVGVGAGYVVHRDALVLLLDPHDAFLALGGEPAPEEDTRGARLLRQLVETQSLSIADLDVADAEYLAGQRGRLVSRAVEMTGAIAEVRSDAITLVLPSEGRFHGLATIGFPAATALSWICLWLLDATAAASAPVAGRAGHRRCPADVVDALARRLHSEAGERLTVALRQSAAVVRTEAESELRDCGLLQVDDDGSWVLTPAAARYRAAELTIGAVGDTGQAAPRVPPVAGGPPPVSLFEELP